MEQKYPQIQKLLTNDSGRKVTVSPNSRGYLEAEIVTENGTVIAFATGDHLTVEEALESMNDNLTPAHFCEICTEQFVASPNHGKPAMITTIAAIDGAEEYSRFGFICDDCINLDGVLSVDFL